MNLVWLAHPEHGVMTAEDQPSIDHAKKNGWEAFVPRGHPWPKNPDISVFSKDWQERYAQAQEFRKQKQVNDVSYAKERFDASQRAVDKARKELQAHKILYGNGSVSKVTLEAKEKELSEALSDLELSEHNWRAVLDKIEIEEEPEATAEAVQEQPETVKRRGRRPKAAVA